LAFAFFLFQIILHLRKKRESLLQFVETRTKRMENFGLKIAKL